MMTEDEARTRLDGLGALARTIVLEGRAAHVRWEPGNGVLYELMIVPWEATEAIEWDDRMPPAAYEGSPGWVYVVRFGSRGRAHPLRMWYLDGTPNAADVSYCTEKWADDAAGGAAIHMLLSAIAGCEPRATFADADCVFEVVAR